MIVVDIRVERGLRDACTAEIGLSRFVEFERKSRQGRSDDACNLGRAFAAGRHSVVDDSVIADIDTRAYKIRESGSIVALAVSFCQFVAMRTDLFCM